MNTAVILAGGVGSRMGVDRPKQYLLVNDKPIIAYCLEIFQNHKNIDNIVVVVSDEWKSYVEECAEKYGITKICGYAPAGRTRQHSIYNGLKSIDENSKDTDVCIIHDAARPLVSDKIIDDCIVGAVEDDGAMPVISVKDTIYQSSDGKSIGSLLKRSELFAGQAPESFNFKKYYDKGHIYKDAEDATFYESKNEKSNDDLRAEYETLKKKVEEMENEMFDKERDWDARFNSTTDK